MPSSLSPQELRRRRLEALERCSSSGRQVVASLAAPAIATPLQPQAPLSTEPESIQPKALEEFHTLMWDDSVTTPSDKLRWVQQGIATTTTTTTTTEYHADPPPSNNNNQSWVDVVARQPKAWGLTQVHGGPCGVLAAVQAEMLRVLLFGIKQQEEEEEQNNNNNKKPSGSSGCFLSFPTTLKDHQQQQQQPPLSAMMLSENMIQQALAMSISTILARAAIMPTHNHHQTGSSNNEKIHTTKQDSVVLISCHYNNNNNNADARLTASDWHLEDATTFGQYSPTTTTTTTTTSRLQSRTISCSCNNNDNNKPSLDERILALAKQVKTVVDTVLPCFMKPGGVLLLVMSLMQTRGITRIRNDMDDLSSSSGGGGDSIMMNKWTSQFGHCSQELINVLLTGQATSNVFDNEVVLGSTTTCRGVSSRPSIGYLTQLEALRYCRVGDYYKTPTFPIWVVGSTSHFTVLFGDAACLKETESDKLLESCRRAFRLAENDEGGFIVAWDLGQVLDGLNIPTRLDPSAVSTLAATLEVSGAGIILWDDFWKACSRLMTGASLERVLGEYGNTVEHNSNSNNNNNGEDQQQQQQLQLLPESDEEMAKRLAAEWNDTTTPAVAAAAAAATFTTNNAATSTNDSAMMDVDEEYARSLQAQWDNELKEDWDGGLNQWPTATTPNESSAMTIATSITTQEEEEEQTPHVFTESKSLLQQQEQGLKFEEFGDSFMLYHYNGLRGGTLTRFSVTRLKAEEAVGSSAAAATAGGGARMAGDGDLEDVVRTKWPSCRIDWLGKVAPYID